MAHVTTRTRSGTEVEDGPGRFHATPHQPELVEEYRVGDPTGTVTLV